MSFLQKVGVGAIVTASSLIAFVATCTPVGYVGLSFEAFGGNMVIVLIMACLIGSLVAAGVGYLVFQGLQPKDRR